MSKLLLLATVLVAATLGVPMVAQANSHADRAISYDTQSETRAYPRRTGWGCEQAALAQHPLRHGREHTRWLSDLVAVGEDDYNEWGSFLSGTDPYAVLGFTMVSAPSSSPFYHQIFLAPPIWSTLNRIDSGGIESVSRADASMAILTLIHEAYHQRLYSGDESRVNACALRDFGSTIQSQFGVSPTVEETVTTPVVTSHRVRTAVWRTIKAREPALDAD